MIVYDNIVKNINGSGGVAVLFGEMIARLSLHDIPYTLLNFDQHNARPLERFLRCRISASLHQEASVFHSTYYRLPSTRIPTVTTVHDFTYERMLGGMKKAIHSIQKNYAILNSDKIICVSKSTKNDLLEYLPKVDESRISVIPNGVSDCYHRIICSEREETMKEKEKKKESTILFVGQRIRYKNFSSLVHALSRMEGLFLECVGGGMFTSKEVSLLEEKLPGRYRHLGFVDNSMLNLAYNQALCLVYPSLYEGFGIPVLEAMKAGCPVVATNCSSLPEVVSDAGILMETGSSEDIEMAIHTLLDDDVRQLYIKKGLIQAEKFSWDKTFIALLHEYEDLTGKSLLNHNLNVFI